MSETEENTQRIRELETNGQADEASSNGQVNQASELELALTAKSEECKTLNEKFLRLAAEFENYKRLSQREQRDQVRFGNEQILKELLPVIDNLERALRSAKESQSQDALIQGVDLTLKQLVGAVAKFGVRPVESIGCPFDPTCHQAVSHMESDTVPENTIIEEFQKGYLLHDRILRPAMVSVSSGPGSGAESKD